MHSVLFDIPNQLHYDCSILTDRRCNRPLDKKYRTIMSKIRALKSNEKLSEEQVRMLYIEVPDAPMMKSHSSNSKANPGYVAVIVQRVLPVLCEILGHQVNSECMIITPYRRQLELWLTTFYSLRKSGWLASELPQIYTVDGSQGRERMLTIIDLVNHKTAGFMSDPKRANVSITRAKLMRILVGGSFDAVKPPFEKSVKYVRDATNDLKVREIELDGPVAFYRAQHKKMHCWEVIRVQQDQNVVVPEDLYVPGKDDTNSNVDNLQVKDAGELEGSSAGEE